MKLTQEYRVEQQLALTQEMRQSLEILQLPVLELKKSIEKELTENPLLEADISEDYHVTDNQSNGVVKETKKLYDDESTYEAAGYIQHDETDSTTDIIGKIAAKEENVLEKIIDEVKLMLKTSEEQKIAEFLIGNIDESGFLKMKTEELNNAMNTYMGKKITIEKIEQVREIIMNIEPMGVGSKDLADYLAFQIEKEKKDEIDKLAIIVLRDYFDDFSRKKVKELTRKLGISEDKLRKIYDRIMKCNPYPLRGYSADIRQEVVTPEIIVKEENGEFEVYLNDKYLPKIKLNNEYYKVLSKDKEAVNYLKEMSMRVRNLTRSIEQRNLTLYRVSKAIVEKQKEFFRKGENFLKPITLMQIADELEFHESTISRVVNGKYMETPRGIFELRYFFSGKVENVNGKEISIVAVQNIIKEIIDVEDRKNPLTDKEISEILDKKGLILSQRTVTNYREAMKILPTYLRKQI